MSRPPGGRLHLWCWVAAGVMLYAASCPPVEAWHEKRYSQNSRKLPLDASAMQENPTHAPSAVSGVSEGEFQIVELNYQEPPEKPVWMLFLYAPVHLVEAYPPFDVLFQHYRRWCDGVL